MQDFLEIFLKSIGHICFSRCKLCIFNVDFSDSGKVRNQINPFDENCVKTMDGEIIIMNPQYPNAFRVTGEQRYWQCIVTLDETTKIKFYDAGFVNFKQPSSKCALQFEIRPRVNVCVDEGFKYFEQTEFEEFTMGKNGIWNITLKIQLNEKVIKGIWFWIQLTGMCLTNISYIRI